MQHSTTDHLFHFHTGSLSANIECVWPSCQQHHGRLLSTFLTMEQIYWIIRPGAVLMLGAFLKTQLQPLFVSETMQRWSNWWRIDEAKVCHFANLVYVYALGCVVCTVYTVLSSLCSVQNSDAVHQQYMHCEYMLLFYRFSWTHCHKYTRMHSSRQTSFHSHSMYITYS